MVMCAQSYKKRRHGNAKIPAWEALYCMKRMPKLTHKTGLAILITKPALAIEVYYTLDNDDVSALQCYANQQGSYTSFCSPTKDRSPIQTTFMSQAFGSRVTLRYTCVRVCTVSSYSQIRPLRSASAHIHIEHAR